MAPRRRLWVDRKYCRIRYTMTTLVLLCLFLLFVSIGSARPTFIWLFICVFSSTSLTPHVSRSRIPCNDRTPPEMLHDHPAHHSPNLAFFHRHIWLRDSL